MTRIVASRPTAASRRRRPEVAPLEGRLLLSSDVLTYHDDATRSGWDPAETALTPGDVNAASFGKRFTVAVDGKVDAQPLVQSGLAIPGEGTHDVLFVATEHDTVYALDAETGATLWQVSLLPPGEVPSDPVAGSQVSPEIGITSTPVIDPTTGTIYVVAMSKSTVGASTVYHQRIHALSTTTGLEKVVPASIDSSIAYPGSGPGGNGTDLIFNPEQYEERDALLLSGGIIYTGWASHSDVAPYTGWSIGFDAATLKLASVINVNPNGKPASSFLSDGSGASFWNSGGGPAADAFGNVYNAVANGPFDPTLDAAGRPTNGDYGDTYIKFTPTPTGLVVSDYFAPYNQQQIADDDYDVGSSGVTLIDVPGPGGATKTLALGSAKDGNIYVVNRAAMGGYNATTNAIYQEIPGALGGPEFGTPARFGGVVYFGGVGAPLKAFAFSGGKLVTTPVGQTSTSYAYPGTTPAVSSNGNTDGIVWAVEDASGGAAVLHAYDALNLSDELYNSAQAPNGRDAVGNDNKFITPTIADGFVYVGTTNGVTAFGLLPGAGPSVLVAASPATNPVLGTSVALSVVATDPTAPASALTYTWGTISAPAGAALPAFSANLSNAASTTTATFNRAGTYTFLVAIRDPSGLVATSRAVAVVIQSPTTVTVIPNGATIFAGGTQPFAAIVGDQFGRPFTVAVPIAYGVVPGGPGAINSAGLYSSSTTGTAIVVGTAGRAVGAASIRVIPAPRTAAIAVATRPATAPNQEVASLALPPTSSTARGFSAFGRWGRPL